MNTGYPSATDLQQVAEILEIVRAADGPDLRAYHLGSLYRRIRRRMRMGEVSRLAEYVDRVRSDVAERNALIKDLLVVVTGFFRDPPAWATFRATVIAPHVREFAPGGVIKAWVPACATGEEAYTLAMLFHEEARLQGRTNALEIHATDLDAANVARAATGAYTSSEVAALEPEQLGRYFDTREGRHCVKEPLRESVRFTTHDLLADPPITGVHLISCRNLLTSMEPEAQVRILELLHGALHPGGHLFLGSREAVGRRAAGLFTAVSREHRIYQRSG